MPRARVYTLAHACVSAAAGCVLVSLPTAAVEELDAHRSAGSEQDGGQRQSAEGREIIAVRSRSLAMQLCMHPYILYVRPEARLAIEWALLLVGRNTSWPRTA